MAAPKKYTRNYSFAGFQANNPQKPLPGQKLDNELDNLELSLNEAIVGLADIRREDGRLRNGIVTAEALAFNISTGVDPAELWVSAKQYQAGNTVSFGAAFYRCVQGHVSDVFADDLAAAYWVKYFDLGDVATTAETARDQAVAAAGAAAGSAGDATGQSDLARNWATKMDGPVAGGEYSAKKYAQDAALVVGNGTGALRYDLVQPLTAPQKAQARNNAGLGTSATRDVGATAGTVAAGDDSRFSFASEGAGAVIRTLQDKLREVVNLLDFRQGGDPDETAALQRAIAMFAARGVGGTIVLPAGRVTVSSTVAVNLSGGTGIDDLVGVNITGPGSGLCQVYWTGGTNDAMFSVTGVSSGLGPVVDLVWGGFSVHTSVPGVGVFFSGDKAGHMQFRDIASYELYRHYQLVDCLVVDFDRCRMSYGIRGLHAYRTSFTYPNAISFSNGCDVGVMNEWGLVIEGGSELNFFGGAIEGNGSNAGLTDRGGVKLIAPGPEGGVAANFFGTYFEYNGGVADINLLANPTHSTAIGLFGPTFNRGPDGVNGQHSVRIDTDVGYGPVNVFGHAAFPSFGGYVPSASTKRIASYGAGPVDFNITGLYKDVVERPDAPNEGVFAACVFDGTLASPTADSATNVASVVKNGTGDYTINFKRAGRAPYFLQPTFDNAYIAAVFAESATSLRVRVFNVAAAVVDPTYCRFRIFC